MCIIKDVQHVMYVQYVCMYVYGGSISSHTCNHNYLVYNTPLLFTILDTSLF